MCPVILKECEVDQDSGPGIQRLKRTGAALGDDKGPRDDGFEEARRADVPSLEGLLEWEHAAALESPNVDGPELVLRRYLLDIERRFRVLDDTKRPTLFDRLFEKRRGFVWERVGSERCVERAATEGKYVDLANESREEVRFGKRTEVGDERVRRLGNV